MSKTYNALTPPGRNRRELNNQRNLERAIKYKNTAWEHRPRGVAINNTNLELLAQAKKMV